MGARTGRSVADLIRHAMTEYLDRERGGRRSVLDLPAHDSGELREPWTRSEVLDETHKSRTTLLSH